LPGAVVMLHICYPEALPAMSIRIRHIAAPALLALFALLALAGCSTTPLPTPTVEPSPTFEPSPTPEPVPTPEPTAKPPDALFDYLAAINLLSAAQYKEAIARFGTVIRLQPDLALAYHGRALAYYNNDLPDLALEDLDRAIELDPDYADAYRNRGVMRLNEGKVSLAAADLERALELYRDWGTPDPEKIADAERLLRSIGR